MHAGYLAVLTIKAPHRWDIQVTERDNLYLLFQSIKSVPLAQTFRDWCMTENISVFLLIINNICWVTTVLVQFSMTHENIIQIFSL